MAFQRLTVAWALLRTLFHIIWTNILSWMNPSEKDLTEEIILITGGGKGIGRSLALLLAQKQPKHVSVREMFKVSAESKPFRNLVCIVLENASSSLRHIW